MKNKRAKSCMLLLIDDDDNSKIFASEINKYYITHNQSIYTF